jgi:hypothetical protein
MLPTLFIGLLDWSGERVLCLCGILEGGRVDGHDGYSWCFCLLCAERDVDLRVIDEVGLHGYTYIWVDAR